MEKVKELRNRFKDHLDEDGFFKSGFTFIDSNIIDAAKEDAIVVGETRSYFNDHYDGWIAQRIYFLNDELVTSLSHWNFYSR